MKTLFKTVNPKTPEAEIIEEAADIIRHGGLVGFPTETVYGLAADALNLDAVRRVYDVKGRPEKKPLPVQVSGIEDVYTLAADVPDRAVRLMQAFFPGPLTLILKASGILPEMVTAGTGTVGVRMPDNPVALALLRAVGGPIVAPSANPSNEPPPVTAEEVMGYFDGRIEMVLSAGPSTIKTASTVLDITVDPPKILRAGVLGESILQRATFSRRLRGRSLTL